MLPNESIRMNQFILFVCSITHTWCERDQGLFPKPPSSVTSSTMVKGSDILLILVSPLDLDSQISDISQVAILFPPAAVAFIAGCSCDLLINICLTLCVLFIPPTLF